MAKLQGSLSVCNTRNNEVSKTAISNRWVETVAKHSLGAIKVWVAECQASRYIYVIIQEFTHLSNGKESMRVIEEYYLSKATGEKLMEAPTD